MGIGSTHESSSAVAIACGDDPDPRTKRHRLLQIQHLALDDAWNLRSAIAPRIATRLDSTSIARSLEDLITKISSRGQTAW
jgi:hypothetical protein